MILNSLRFRSILGALTLSFLGHNGFAATLEDCYRKAVHVSETLAITEEEIRQIEQEYRRGVASALPDISWNMTQLYQDTSNVQQSTGVQGTLLQQRRQESYFQLVQPIFHGFREYN